MERYGHFAFAAFGLVATAAQAGNPKVAEQDLATYQERARKVLLKLDTDKDAKVSQAEWSADPRRGANPRGFSRMDANADGYIDAAEIDASYAARFKRIDANGDGMVDRAEQQGANSTKAQR